MLIGYLRPHGDDEAGHAAERRALAEAGCEQVIEEQPDADGSDKQPELHALLARKLVNGLDAALSQRKKEQKAPYAMAL